MQGLASIDLCHHLNITMSTWNHESLNSGGGGGGDFFEVNEP